MPADPRQLEDGSHLRSGAADETAKSQKRCSRCDAPNRIAADYCANCGNVLSGESVHDNRGRDNLAHGSARGSRRGLRWVPTVLIAALFVVYMLAGSSVSSPAGWTDDFDAALEESKSTGRPMVVAFHSAICPPCKLMDRTVFTEPIVQKALSRFVPVRLDIDKDARIAARFGVNATPTYTVIDHEREAITQASGAMSVEGFLMFLKDATGGKSPPQAAAPEPVPPGTP